MYIEYYEKQIRELQLECNEMVERIVWTPSENTDENRVYYGSLLEKIEAISKEYREERKKREDEYWNELKLEKILWDAQGR